MLTKDKNICIEICYSVDLIFSLMYLCCTCKNTNVCGNNKKYFFMQIYFLIDIFLNIIVYP